MEKEVRAYKRRKPLPKPTESTAKQVLYNAGTDRVNRCDMCASGFDSETEVEVHKLISHRDKLEAAFAKQFGCSVCLKTFKTKQLLREHLEKQHLYINNQSSKIAQPVYVCEKCSMLYFNKTCLIIHIRQKHTKKRRHGNEDKIPCPVCDKPVSPHNMMQHMDVIHTRSLKFCPICMVRQDKIASLPTHVSLHHPVTYRCAFCDFDAGFESALNRHLSSVHGKRPVACVGHKRTGVLELYTQVKIGRTRVGRMQFPDRGLNLTEMAAVCVLCQQVVYSAQAMVEHIDQEHGHTYDANTNTREITQPDKLTIKKLKTCSYCGATFTNEVLFKHHIFKMHTLSESTEDEYIVTAGGNEEPVFITINVPNQDEETDSQTGEIYEIEDAGSQSEVMNTTEETDSEPEEVMVIEETKSPTYEVNVIDETDELNEIVEVEIETIESKKGKFGIIQYPPKAGLPISKETKRCIDEWTE